MDARDDMKPGDEGPPQEPSTGEDVCPECQGSGKVDGQTCGSCQGTGEVQAAIGGG